ncbi:Ribonucleoside-diphosphate reductase large subunit [Portunus trituberculatus]|uniref:Ribonucleoside-diphosphate reductase large subunit n=1 Tax=Portunus trituberculatus TaxID=210409 RepID=A0A5B7H6K7_PORTR|nr:Ribonucleoside-diphosphate reductase large subunit [Portunus trituberculatus]
MTSWCRDVTVMNRLGLKTGMYYLRTKPAANAIQFTVDKTKVSKTVNGDSHTNGTNSESSKNGSDDVTSHEAQNMADMAKYSDLR